MSDGQGAEKATKANTPQETDADDRSKGSAGLLALLTAFAEGRDDVGDILCRRLEPAIRSEVNRFLPASDPERDDVVQETLLAFLHHLRRTGTPPNRPDAFVITMVGNRCRNLYRQRKRRPGLERKAAWPLPSPSDPLDSLESEELADAVRTEFAAMDEACRTLLLAIYVEERSMEELQREAGLTTVQGVYYRKYSCLKKLHRLLKSNPLSRLRGGHSK